jgi:hypothetical protein
MMQRRQRAQNGGHLVLRMMRCGGLSRSCSPVVIRMRITDDVAGTLRRGTREYRL